MRAAQVAVSSSKVQFVFQQPKLVVVVVTVSVLVDVSVVVVVVPVVAVDVVTVIVVLEVEVMVTVLVDGQPRLSCSQHQAFHFSSHSFFHIPLS